MGVFPAVKTNVQGFTQSKLKLLLSTHLFDSWTKTWGDKQIPELWDGERRRKSLDLTFNMSGRRAQQHAEINKLCQEKGWCRLFSLWNKSDQNVVWFFSALLAEQSIYIWAQGLDDQLPLVSTISAGMGCSITSPPNTLCTEQMIYHRAQRWGIYIHLSLV